MARRHVRGRMLTGGNRPGGDGSSAAPGQAGRYARWELERRFLVTALPEHVLQGSQSWAIHDRYLVGTQLRLRVMDPRFDGPETIWKLGKKEAPEAPDFTRTTITTIYLTEQEYVAFATVPAHELRKTRHRLPGRARSGEASREVEDGQPIAVDVFDGPLRGLVLAEVGYETEDELTMSRTLPAWLAREVSDDPRLTGAALAALDAPAAERLVASL